MATTEDEIHQLKSYFKHHRIVTYVMLGFIVLSTLVLINSIQSLNNQQTSQSRAAEGGLCPAQQLTFSENSCIGGQAKGMYVRCRRGDRLKLIECERAGVSGNILQCCDVRGQDFQNKIAQYCGCAPTAAPTNAPTSIPTAIPTSIPPPALIPNCGASCDTIAEISGCVGGAVCMRKGPADCAVGYPCPGKCGGPVCSPTPTTSVVQGCSDIPCNNMPGDCPSNYPFCRFDRPGGSKFCCAGQSMPSTSNGTNPFNTGANDNNMTTRGTSGNQ